MKIYSKSASLASLMVQEPKMAREHQGRKRPHLRSHSTFLSVPAPTNASLEVLPALLQANQPCLQLASAVITRSPESASQASVPGAVQAAASLTNFRTNEARLQSAGVSRASMSHDVAEFWVKPLTNRIKKCAGCGGAYVNELCADICVATEDIYTLTFSSGQTISDSNNSFPSFMCNLHVNLDPDQRSKLARGLQC